MVRDNVEQVMAHLAESCRTAGRQPGEVTLVAVTKFAPVEAISEAIEAGVLHIAENRVQEAQNKFPGLTSKHAQVTAHIIGHLQTNKARDAIAVANVIQSLDSLKLAQEIEKQAGKLNKVADVLVQFNTAREPQKFGASPDEAYFLLESIGQLPHIKINGLMAMAPLTEDKGVIRQAFADLRQLAEEAKLRFFGHPQMLLSTLSMGMSGDYQIAIEEGSTMVRIGSAIFK
jgi:PLP dependent protein